MNTPVRRLSRLIGLAAASVMVAACSMPQDKPDAAFAARARLNELQASPTLAGRAPVEIKDAEQAVIAAEAPQRDTALSSHLVQMAERKVDIAWARAQGRQYESERAALGEQSANARLDSRTREADRANSVARSALAEADAARNDADSARIDADSARRDSEELQRQILELNARETDRGLVVTLGDLLFATGKSDLRGGAPEHLGKLAGFLHKYPDRKVLIEGHTDNVGSDDANQGLSQRRARSVMAYLVAQGIDAGRITATGLGEDSPVADNDSDTGRQQNRRVEVIISNASLTAR